MTEFTQVYLRPKMFLLGSSAKVCDESWVILTIEASYKKRQIFYVEVYNVLLFCEVKIKMHVTYNEWILLSML